MKLSDAVASLKCIFHNLLRLSSFTQKCSKVLWWEPQFSWPTPEFLFLVSWPENSACHLACCSSEVAFVRPFECLLHLNVYSEILQSQIMLQWLWVGRYQMLLESSVKGFTAKLDFMIHYKPPFVHMWRSSRSSLSDGNRHSMNYNPVFLILLKYFLHDTKNWPLRDWSGCILLLK